MSKATYETYVNRQGNAVTVIRTHEGTVLSVAIEGTGSNRAFQAQLSAAKIKANASTVR